MPIKCSKDKISPFFQFGKHGTKYRYKPKDKDSRLKAKELAEEQEKAIYANGYRENK